MVNSSVYVSAPIETAKARFSPVKLLCIDDEPHISEAIARRIHSYDVEVLRAYHGMHGFWLAVTEKPDVVVTDLNMPQGDGTSVIECLKRNSSTRDIPVIVLSGRFEASIRRQAEEAGAVGYITKPAAFEELLELLARCVEIRPREANMY